MANYINICFRVVILIMFLFTAPTVFSQSNNNSYVFNGASGYAGILDSESLTSTANKAAYQYFDNPSFSNNNISVEAWVYLIGENSGVKDANHLPIV